MTKKYSAYSVLIDISRSSLVSHSLLTFLFLCLFFFLDKSGYENSNEFISYWYGGFRGKSSLLVILFRISFVVLVFNQNSRILDILNSNLVIYLLARIELKKNLYIQVYIISMSICILLSTYFHLLFITLYTIINGPTTFLNYPLYALMDILSIAAMFALYFVIDLLFKFEDTLFWIVGIYILNTVLPIQKLIAVSTAKLGIYAYETISPESVFSSSLVSLSIIIFGALVISLRKEISSC